MVDVDHLVGTSSTHALAGAVADVVSRPAARRLRALAEAARPSTADSNDRAQIASAARAASVSSYSGSQTASSCT